MGNYAKSAALVVIGGIAVYFHVNAGDKKSVKTPKDPPAESSLVKLAFVFRHGERSPLMTRPNDPYPLEDPNFWPDGKGSLTKIGKKNAYLLGKRLRQRYDTILTPHYSKDNFTALSTQVERTLMSAYLVLAGLYPPAGHQKWSEEINWTPVPVYHNTVFNKDTCFSCSRFKYEVVKVADSIPADHFAPLVKFLNEKTDFKLKQPERPIRELLFLADSLFLQKRQGYKTMDWADEYLKQAKGLIHDMYISFTVKTDVQKQLSSSLLADHLLQFMESKTKVSMFSGHDLTLYILAAAIGFDLKEAPYPTACIAVEFHEINGEKLVKAFYIKETAGEMVPVEMACGETCSLTSFKEMLLRLKPDDYSALCNTLPEDADSFRNPFLERLVDGFAGNPL